MIKQIILGAPLLACLLYMQGCSLQYDATTPAQPNQNDEGGYYDENGVFVPYDDKQQNLQDDIQSEDGYADNNNVPFNNGVIPQPPQPQLQENPNIIEIEAVGIGVAPESCTPAQGVALAKRAAIVDAYRQLGEQMYGVQVTATDNVRNMMLKNSSIKTKINAIIRGAQVKDSSCQQGVCQVNVELKLDSRIWSQIFGI